MAIHRAFDDVSIRVVAAFPDDLHAAQLLRLVELQLIPLRERWAVRAPAGIRRAIDCFPDPVVGLDARGRGGDQGGIGRRLAAHLGPRRDHRGAAFRTGVGF